MYAGRVACCPGESWWVSRRDRQRDGPTPNRCVTLSARRGHFVCYAQNKALFLTCSPGESIAHVSLVGLVERRQELVEILLGLGGERRQQQLVLSIWRRLLADLGLLTSIQHLRVDHRDTRNVISIVYVYNLFIILWLRSTQLQQPGQHLSSLADFHLLRPFSTTITITTAAAAAATTTITTTIIIFIPKVV